MSDKEFCLITGFMLGFIFAKCQLYWKLIKMALELEELDVKNPDFEWKLKMLKQFK